MRVIVIDAKKLEVREENPDVKSGGIAPGSFLSYLYCTIECTTVDVNRAEKYDIWIDDEGLLKDPKRFVTINTARYGEMTYAGTLVLTGVNSDGEAMSLPEDVKVAVIKKSVVFQVKPE